MYEDRIYLLPMGSEDILLLEEIAAGVSDAFGLPVACLSSVPVPEAAYNEGRGQYYSTMVLRGLRTHLSADALRLLAITDMDIYVPRLNFVFGEAAVDGMVCIISTYRLHPEYYGKQPNRRLFVERSTKEAVHELGHTFGLRHCSDPHCIMFFSNDIEDTDRKSVEFCNEDAAQIRHKLATLRKAA